MPELAVHNSQGKKTGTISLPETVFKKPVNEDVIYQAVIMYQNNKRQGTASTKERGSVSGGGVKPYRQKGTGRARAGSIRSPLWKGGGVVFGPHPRDFSYQIPAKIRKSALRESLNAKFQSEDLYCIDQVAVASGKTKEFAKILSDLKIKGKVLALLDGSDEATLRSLRNIAAISSTRASDANALDILSNKKVLATKQALEALLKRIQ